MRKALKKLEALAKTYDSSPYSISSLGEKLWTAGLAKAENKSVNDPEYSRIEKLRRDSSEEGHHVFLCQELGLGLPQASYQHEVLRRNTPAWARIGLAASRVRLTGRVSTLEHRVQRGREGWAPSDAWNADKHIAHVVAGMLTWLVEEGHSWPGESDEHPTLEAWQSTVKKHAQALRLYAQGDPERETALNAWHELATNPATQGTEQEKDAMRHVDELDAQRTRDAQAALHWVADNLPTLWD